jgi:hypothetical protein
MASSAPPLGPEDAALLERVAARIVELHLEVPAILSLEGGRPLSLLASQSLIFFEPVVTALFRLDGYRRFAALVERRDVVERLTSLIETRAEEAHRARREAGAARRAVRASRGRRPQAR